LFTLWVVLSFPADAADTQAHSFPSRPIRFIVPFAAGGGTDIAGRIYAANLAPRLAQNVVIDNRPGAAGTIGVDLTINAIPDGYTICLISASHAINSATNTNLPYDLGKDVQGVSQITSAFLIVVVHNALPLKSVRELIAHAKENPGRLNYGSSGSGGISHLAGAMFGHMTGTAMVHIPYRGEAAALTDLLAARTQLQFASPLNARPHILGGRLRALAVTSTKRSSASPELPTVAEAGVPGYEVEQWYGVVTSPRVPRAVVDKLSVEFAVSARSPELVQRLQSDGLEAVASKPDAFSLHVKNEITKWRKLVRDAGIQLQ
jgi:tripartite-type tricarboxylate transporter receptor subunit TctC